MKAPYPYGPEWKAAVDRSSPAWAEYCEATTLVKRYLKTRLRFGKQAAINEFEDTCELYRKKSAAKEGRVIGVRQRFLLVWENERKDLEALVLAEDAETLGHAA